MNKREEKQQLIEIAISEYLDTPKEERSLTKLGEKYSIKRQTLSKYLKLQGHEVINYQNLSRIDEAVFDNIDTEEKAYWLGFLYADGNISSTGNRLEVRLSIKDLEHLEKFRAFLKLSTEIRTGICNGNGFCHLAVRNKHIWNQLNNKGCVPKKSLILTFPNNNIFSNYELIYDFIRGYVDGDGCLCYYKEKNSIVTELNLVGTLSFLLSVKNFFNESGYIRNKTCKNYDNKAYSLSYSNVPSRKIARLLYENAHIYLKRKYEKYLYFCHLEEESSKRTSTKIGEPCNGNTEVIN